MFIAAIFCVIDHGGARLAFIIVDFATIHKLWVQIQPQDQLEYRSTRSVAIYRMASIPNHQQIASEMLDTRVPH